MQLPFAEIHIDVAQILENLGILAISFVIVLPVAIDRETSSRRLGMRTFPLVSMASTGFILIAQSVLGWESPEQGRVLAGLMTGIGFLGGGAIVKSGTDVHGTATAASIWGTAAIGAAVAYRRFEVAIALVLVIYLALRWLKPVKEAVNGDD